MNVGEALARLSRGPLSNLAIGMEGAGTIQSDKVSTVVDFINEALLHLHTRFVLNEKQVIIEQSDLITSYKLTSANSIRTNVNGYIKDASPQPAFTDDLLKILGIFDDCGDEYPLNDEGAHNSLFTPRIDTIQVPNPQTGSAMFVLYQASHATLTTTLTEVIDLPLVLVEAMIAYAAHKVFDHMNGQEHLLKAKDLYSKYESICQEVEAKDMLNMSVSKTSTKFSERGFV